MKYLERKSAIGVFGGASSFVCKHNSMRGVLRISGTWNWQKFLYLAEENRRNT